MEAVVAVVTVEDDEGGRGAAKREVDAPSWCAWEVDAPAEVEVEAAIAEHSTVSMKPGESRSISMADATRAKLKPGNSPSCASSCSAGGTSYPVRITGGFTSSASSFTRRIGMSS